ncbi:MAG: MFS transporter [Solirubrobacterales bacterium]|nr:MFS transporter [Solirubrobacterales bacterium]
MVLLDGSTVAIALPKLQDGLSLSVVELQWVINAASIAWAVLLVPAGRRADRIGHWLNLRQGLVPLAAGSACAAVAPSFAVLVVGRVGQGIGAAMTLPSVIALLTQAAPRRERGQAVGRFGAVLGLLELLCPLYGGLLVVILGWRAVFVSPLLLSLAAGALLRRRVPEAAGSATPAMDWAGTVLLAAIVLALVFGAIQVNSSGIGSLPTLALFGAAVVAAAGFVVAERRSSAPTLELSLLRSAEFSAPLAVLFIVFFALGVYFFFITIYLQRALHMSALLAAAGLWIPTSLFTVLLSVRIGRVGDRTSQYPLVMAGLLALSGGLLLTISGTSSLTYVDLLPAIVAVGLAMALFRTPLLSLIYNAVPAGQAGMGTAAAELVGRLGGVVGVAIGVTVFLAVSTGDVNAKLPAAGIEHHFTAAQLRSLWSNPTLTKQEYRALPAPVRAQLRKIVKDTANDAFATTLYVCTALVGVVGLALIAFAAHQSRYRRRGNVHAASSGFR